MRLDSDKASLLELSENLLRDWSEHRGGFPHQEPELLWHGADLPWPSEGANVQGSQNLAFRLPGSSGRVNLYCRNLPVAEMYGDQIPFQDESMGRIVLWHMLETGMEPEVAEVRRLLQADGELIVIGLNRFGWRNLRHRRTQVPCFSPLAMRSRMISSNFELTGFHAAGFAGRSWPARADLGAARAVAPVCDIVLLAFRRDEPALSAQVGKAKLSTVGAQ